MTEQLQSFLQSDHHKADKCIAALFFLDAPSRPIEIRSTLISNGLKDAKDWNITSILDRTKGLAISVESKWKLTNSGLTRLTELGISKTSPQLLSTLVKLRAEIAKLQSENTRKFLLEAVTCLDAGCYRAAVIMSWVAAVHILHQKIVSSHINEFNAEALKRDPKWKPAKTGDDLARMGEADFLDISSKIGAVQKNTKAELKVCLDRRNACGHPNTYALSELTACHHVESLVLNVFGA